MWLTNALQNLQKTQPRTPDVMPILTLRGCPSEPLGNYLKALGIFRLVAEQGDPTVRAWWEGGVLRLLMTKFTDTDTLVDWLHEECAYTALVAPWLANTGWGKGGKRDAGREALETLLRDNKPRTARFRSGADLTVSLADHSYRRPSEQVPATHVPLQNWVSQFKPENQGSIIAQLRNCARTPELLDWLDAVGAVEAKEQNLMRRWFPLFAKGGSEGSGNYIVRQQQYLAASFKDDPVKGKQRLVAAISGGSHPGLLETNSLAGLFFPGFRGDPNIGQTFDAQTRVNPWDFILLIEGLLFFRAAVTRRLGVQKGSAAFPFYCDASLGGSPTLGIREVAESDKSISSGEIWCPLWDKPLDLGVLRSVLSEGRFQVAGRTVRKAAQFALAVGRFGCDRGITVFLRYGLIRRSGSYGKKDQTAPLAIPLGSFPVARLAKLALIEDLIEFDEALGWRSGVHLGAGNNHPARLLLARASYDDAWFKAISAAAEDSADDAVLNLAVALGAMIREFGVTRGRVRSGRGDKATSPRNANAPLPSALSRGWADLKPESNPPEFRLARALASVLPWGEHSRKAGQPAVGPLMTNLVPVSRYGKRWGWDELSRSVVWSESATLFANLGAVLHRRLVDSQSSKGDGLPFASFYPASFADLLALWNGQLDEARLVQLIRGLALVDFGSDHGEEKFAAWQTKNDETPSLSHSGVWFDAKEQAHINVRSSGQTSELEQEAAFALPRAYPLLKLCFSAGQLPAVPLHKGVARRSGSEPFPNSPLRLLNLLRAGRGDEALVTAAQMLRAKGYAPIVRSEILSSGEWQLSSADSQRMAGMLLIPVRHVGVLASLSIKPKRN